MINRARSLFAVFMIIGLVCQVQALSAQESYQDIVMRESRDNNMFTIGPGWVMSGNLNNNNLRQNADNAELYNTIEQQPVINNRTTGDDLPLQKKVSGSVSATTTTEVTTTFADSMTTSMKVSDPNFLTGDMLDGLMQEDIARGTETINLDDQYSVMITRDNGNICINGFNYGSPEDMDHRGIHSYVIESREELMNHSRVIFIPYVPVAPGTTNEWHTGIFINKIERTSEGDLFLDLRAYSYCNNIYNVYSSKNDQSYEYYMQDCLYLISSREKELTYYTSYVDIRGGVYDLKNGEYQYSQWNDFSIEYGTWVGDLNQGTPSLDIYSYDTDCPSEHSSRCFGVDEDGQTVSFRRDSNRRTGTATTVTTPSTKPVVTSKDITSYKTEPYKFDKKRLNERLSARDFIYAPRKDDSSEDGPITYTTTKQDMSQLEQAKEPGHIKDNTENLVLNRNINVKDLFREDGSPDIGVLIIPVKESNSLEDMISSLENKKDKTDLENEILTASQAIQKESPLLDENMVREFEDAARLALMAESMKDVLGNVDFTMLKNAFERLSSQTLEARNVLNIESDGYYSQMVKILIDNAGIWWNDKEVSINDYFKNNSVNMVQFAVKRLKARALAHDKKAINILIIESKLNRSCLTPAKDTYLSRMREAMQSFTHEVNTIVKTLRMASLKEGESETQAVFALPTK